MVYKVYTISGFYDHRFLNSALLTSVLGNAKKSKNPKNQILKILTALVQKLGIHNANLHCKGL